MLEKDDRPTRGFGKLPEREGPKRAPRGGGSGNGGGGGGEKGDDEDKKRIASLNQEVRGLSGLRDRASAAEAALAQLRREHTAATSAPKVKKVQAVTPGTLQLKRYASSSTSSTVYPKTRAAPARLLRIRPTHPMTKNVAQGRTMTIPSHATIFPVPDSSIRLVAGSIRHHEIAAMIT